MEATWTSASFDAMTRSSPADGPVTEAPYGASLDSDAALFADRLEALDAMTEGMGPVAEALLDPLDRMNIDARELIAYAENAIDSDRELSPSEIVRLTAQSQEFMFHAQLTANVANRTSDGLQQLFRQQS